MPPEQSSAPNGGGGALRSETVAFLKDWLAWVERGAPEGEPYSRADGLCANAFHWSGDHRALYRDLRATFKADVHPFGQPDYLARMLADTQHECPKRLAWVREQIAAAEQSEPVS